ncbi:GFA family protein [Roseobacter sp.]|uniref:GFA family protein n=1 Tax=Roseobacter sp. TaxID=1907202 RepID=UPI0025E4ADF4|nr:GFA family protein [Roseobacter sp.]
MPRTGSRLCGTVEYEIRADISQTGACHCGMCRKWSGGVYPGVEVPDGGLPITRTDQLKTCTSSPWAERVFYGACGSRLWYRVSAPGSHQGTYHPGFGTLDDTDRMEMT